MKARVELFAYCYKKHEETQKCFCVSFIARAKNIKITIEKAKKLLYNKNNGSFPKTPKELFLWT